MAFLRRWLLILCALFLGSGQLWAESAKEKRIYAAAVSTFQSGLWNQAETGFAAFLEEYPDSTNAPEAALLQAQAQFKQGDFTNAVTTLENHLHLRPSWDLADQFVYWIGESQFAEGNFQAAAETFDSLVKDFPESSQRLPALVESASALARLKQWPAVENLLESTNEVFQSALAADAASELVLRGQLLRAQAKFELTDYAGAAAILGSQNAKILPPGLDWPWFFLLGRTHEAMGDLSDALATTTNLLSIADVSQNNEWRAAGVALQADLLEKSGQTNAAIEDYSKNLQPGVPDESQQQAVLKIAGLALAQKDNPAVETNLLNFVTQFSNSPAADVAWLTIGELQLADYVLQPSATNRLALATSSFSRLLESFPDSPQAGRAYLGRGWCDWFAKQIPDSVTDFQAAVDRLPPSEALAVAKFKLGDALFLQNDFAGALANYHSVLTDFQNFPDVAAVLGAPALYQVVQADLKLNDVAGASKALAGIENFYPADEKDLSGALMLVGETLTDVQQPAGARVQFEKIEKQFPSSPLLPQLRLAIARTYAQERNWPAAIAGYTAWQKDFSTNQLRAQVDYALARANFQAGNETNALALFTGFLARFPVDRLAPSAQWWIADYYFRTGNYNGAETSYENIFQNTNAVWQSSPLFYKAQLMAGHAAMMRQGFPDAKGYFAGLFGDSNCPPALGTQARFAYGIALMQILSADTNNQFANFQAATNVFAQIYQMNPTNDAGARAWGEIANCALAMGDFSSATNAYAQVFNSPWADIAARSQAQVGFGSVLETLARTAGAGQTNLLNQALSAYLNVFSGANLRDDEKQDAFWTKKAGLQAAVLVGTLYDSAKQIAFYRQVEKILPQLKNVIEAKIAALSPGKI